MPPVRLFPALALGLLALTGSGTAAAQGWTSQAKLYAGDPAPDEQFGNDLALWDGTAVVGAHGDAGLGADAGAVHVFVDDAGNWVEQARLVAADTTAGSRFGRAVDLRADTAVIGSPGHLGTGACYVFRRVGGVWTEEAQLFAADADPGDEFGWSVAVSSSAIVVGAFRDDEAGTDAGAVYVFVRDGASWVQASKITALDAAPGDSFGYAVNVSDDTILVGAPGDDDLGTGSGSAYTYRRTGPLWVIEDKMLASDGASFDSFGRAVSIDGTSLVVGAIGNNTGGSDAGSAYVFTREVGGWQEQQRLLADDPFNDDWFGSAVDIDGDTVVVGALSVDGVGLNSGAAYVFGRTAGIWSQQEQLTAVDAESGDQFGVSVSIWGEEVLVGASWDDDLGPQSGSAHVHHFEAPGSWEDLGGGSPGALGVPVLNGAGTLFGGSTVLLDLSGCPPSALLLGWVSTSSTPWDALGGTIHAYPFSAQYVFRADVGGGFRAATTWPVGVPPGTEGWFQFLVEEPTVPDGIVLSNALKITTP